MAEEDQGKPTFVTKWVVFILVVMMFGLKMAPAMFNGIIMEIFTEYIPGYMQVFLNNINEFGERENYLQHIKLCIQKCRETKLALILPTARS